MLEPLFFFAFGLATALLIVNLRRRYGAFFGQTPDDYADDLLSLDLRERLRGSMICEGVIFGPMGRVTSSFVADFEIAWDGPRGVMDEHFRYHDGSTQKRQWVIILGEGGHFTAEAEDVPGGGRGVQSGSAVLMRYPIRLPESSGGHLLKTVDWMYLTPDGVIMNRSQFRMFGFKVAELIATIRPKETE